jgi:S-adenosylmethionine/arginine decarboxylase-like enzyme
MKTPLLSFRRKPPVHDKHAVEAADPALGTSMHVFSTALRGRLDEQVWRAFLLELAKALAMTPIALPAQWSYPMDGRGGNGLTIIQPITESFLAVETWPDHDGAYLFVCSCRPIMTGMVFATLRRFELEPRKTAINHRLEL